MIASKCQSKQRTAGRRRWLALAALVIAPCACIGAERALAKGHAPVYSPDGRQIAFERDVGERRVVGLFTRSSGKVEFPDLGPGSSCHAAFAPDGTLYYIYSNITNTNYELFNMRHELKTGCNVFRLRDGRPERVTSGFCHDMTPALSPDGKMLYFGSTRDDKRRFNCSIFTLDLSNPSAAPVRALPGDMNYCSGAMSPSISPDGKKVVWGEYGGWTPPYCIQSAPIDDPAGKKPLTSAPEFAFAPRFDPSGRYVCYSSVFAGERWGVRVIELATGKVRRLADGMEPAFSPDGRQLAYERDGMIYECDFNAEEAFK